MVRSRLRTTAAAAARRQSSRPKERGWRSRGVAWSLGSPACFLDGTSAPSHGRGLPKPFGQPRYRQEGMTLIDASSARSGTDGGIRDGGNQLEESTAVSHSPIHRGRSERRPSYAVHAPKNGGRKR